METPDLPAGGCRGTVAIETHGCKLNQADSEVLARQFIEAGFRLVDRGVPADIYVVNTCTVTRIADRKAREALRAAAQRNPGALLVATGCYAERAAQELAQVSGVGLVLGNRAKGSLVNSVLRFQGDGAVPCATGGEVLRPALPGRTRSFVKIQEGCNQVCAYCIVPKVRGRERSIPPEELVQRVQARVEEGYQEVVLTGTQLGSYGFDLRGMNLERLLQRILEETGVPRLRVSSLQAQEITLSLLHLWVDNPRLCPHFHMPLQSGSDSVLRRMRRRYTGALYAERVELVRSLIPGVAVTTDVIVGFPGESEQEFQESLRFCEHMSFSAVHVFPYSIRPGTSAAYFQDQVRGEVKKRRAQEMLALAKRLARRSRLGFLGKVRPVLWEQRKALNGLKLWSGLTDNYLRVYAFHQGDLTNRITPVVVTGEQGEALWARVLPGVEVAGAL